MMQPTPARSPIFPLLLVLALVMGATAGIATRYYARHGGKDTVIGGIFDPRAQFNFKDRVNVLVMGIDDNWTNKDIVYTRGARTDTLLVASLDLVNQKAYLLSI